MKTLLCKIIKQYQKVSVNRPNKCGLLPTCSNYAITAINRFGAFKGLLLTVLRLFVCAGNHPVGFVHEVPQNLKGDFKWLI